VVKVTVKDVMTLVVVLTLLSIITCGIVVVNAQEGSVEGVIRHSPGVISKILSFNFSIQQLSSMLNSTNVDALLGDEGLGNGVLNVTNVVNSLASNPKAAAQLTSNDVVKLASLTGKSNGRMPSDLRVDLSLLASLAKDPKLREVLKEWALTGNVDLQYLKDNVDVSSLSPDDLAILKSALGLASRYGLLNPKSIRELGLDNVTPEDLEAVANIAKRLANLSKDPQTAELLRELAGKSSNLSYTSNLTTEALQKLMVNVGSNAALPYVIKSLTEGLRELTLPRKGTSTPSAPEIPKLNLPSLHLQGQNFRLNTADVLPFLRIVLVSVIGVLLLYLVSKLVKEKARYMMLSMRKDSVIPQIEEAGGINTSVIRAYWEAVAFLSTLIPLSPSETHREYLRKAKSVAGTAFEQLTKMYELARWSGQRLEESQVVVASKLLKAVKSAIRKGVGGGGG